MVLTVVPLLHQAMLIHHPATIRYQPHLLFLPSQAGLLLQATIGHLIVTEHP